eukprot:comp17904_c0_seq1/m.18155 comp17904_c0_seq1/g.18155  ORF comp17904_c0_seq1/g.18155 comp17904_c0_seq1/m.18155 type:complete len:856 (-) comp17904_c0_seq1:911-3478(-)
MAQPTPTSTGFVWPTEIKFYLPPQLDQYGMNAANVGSGIEKSLLPEFNYEPIVQLLAGTGTVDLMTYKDYGMPALIFAGVLLAWAILFGLCGCITACCRCCNNCGGSQDQRRPKTVRRFGLTGFMIFTTMWLLFMAAGFLWCNSRINSGLEVTSDWVNGTIGGLQDFVDLTISQGKSILDVAEARANWIVDDAKAVGTFVAGPIQDHFRTDVNNLIGAARTAVDNGESAVSSLAEQFKNLATSVNSLGQQLETKIDDANATYMGIKNKCNDPIILASPEATQACNEISSLKINGITVTVPQINSGSLFDSINTTLHTTNISAKLDQVQDVFDSLPQKINDMVGPKVEEIRPSINSTLGGVRTQIADIEAQADIEGLVTNFTTNMTSVAKPYMDKLMPIRNGLGVINPVVDLVMVAMALYCIIGGLVIYHFYNNALKPWNRGPLSHRTGNVYVAVAAFCFLLGFMVGLTAFLHYLIGQVMSVACVELQGIPPRAITMTVDSPDYIAAKGYLFNTLIGSIGLNVTANQTVSALLNRCNDKTTNTTLLEVLGIMDQFVGDFNITGMVGDINGTIDQAVDISNIDFYPPAVKNAVGDIIAKADSMDWSQVDKVSQLSPSTITKDFNFTKCNDSLMVAEKKLEASDPTGILGIKALANQAATLRTQLGDINTMLTNGATDLTNRLSSTVTDAKDRVTGLKSDVININSSISTLNTNLQSDGVKMVKERAYAFVDRVLGNVTSLVNDVTDYVEHDMMQCRFIPTLLESTTGLVCNYWKPSVEAMWVFSASTMLFCVFQIIVALKLSKYFKKQVISPEDAREEKLGHIYNINSSTPPTKRAKDSKKVKGPDATSSMTLSKAA